jgi:hypothetical protein
MEKAWDSLLKRLAQHSAQSLLDRFAPGATFIRFLPEGLEPVKRSKSRRDKKPEEALAVDLLMEARWHGEPILVHIEVQTYNQYEMDERLLGYNRKIKKKHGKTPLPCALFLAPRGEVMTTPIVEYVAGELILHFAPRVQNVSEWQTQALLDSPQIGLLPLLPLTKDGRRIDLVDGMLGRLEREGDRLLLDIGAVLAEYAFELYRGDLNWLYRRIGMIRDIEDLPLLKGMLEKGRKQGLEEGRKQRLEQELASLRQTTVALTQVRFPALAALAKEQAAQIKDPALLQDLIVKVGGSAAEEEARMALLNRHPTDKTNE